jgi:membrane protein DedA with SNARE-associated domain
MRLGPLSGLRTGLGLVLALHLYLHFHIHHQFRGPSLDYGALALAAAASWFGLPGPGEPVLIAGGVLAAHHRLDIASVLIVAWAGATAGGIGGWVLGLKTGRALILGRGPFKVARERAVERGEQIFARMPVLAILVAPSWIAGINRAPARVFLPVNALSAAGWAVGIGLGAFYVGPAVIDFVDDLGWVLGTAFVVLVVVTVVGTIRQRRRTRRRRAATAEAPTNPGS